ncbi:hypothetical protein DFH27DRAFT_522311 [Peziza echinospora]|nr:hypothetical protein DFH27DRAFT_522311 [Peziza echinospora]
MLCSQISITIAFIVACVAGLPLPGIGAGNKYFREPGNGISNGLPGRILTKTYTYDSTKDLDDPCNPVTGDPEKCLRSMEPQAEISLAPYASEHDVVAEGELAFAKDIAQASGSDFDYIYQREPKKTTSHSVPPQSRTVPSSQQQQAPSY